MIWADRVALGATVLAIIAVAWALATGTLSLSYLAMSMSTGKSLLTDAEVGIGSPTFVESAKLISTLILSAIFYFLLPLWAVLRVVDFVMTGKIRR